MMIDCPPLRYEFPIYVTAQRIISTFTTVMNCFTIYCILFRTPKRAGAYKWHLLWHQAIAAITDFEMGVIAVPMFILPFTIMVPNGLILQFPVYSPNTMVATSILFITGSLAAVVQLFVYRYLRATGSVKFPLSFKILITVTYLFFMVPGLAILYIFDKRGQMALMEELRNNFSCLSVNHTNRPMSIVYDSEKYETFVGTPIFLINFYFAIVSGLLIFSTFRYLQKSTISKRTASLEKKFLCHLMIQVLTPLVIVHAPGYLLMIVQTRQIYGFEELGIIGMMSMSVYGAMCGMMIILLTPSYRCILFRKVKISSPSIGDNSLTSKILTNLITTNPVEELEIFV